MKQETTPEPTHIWANLTRQGCVVGLTQQAELHVQSQRCAKVANIKARLKINKDVDD